MPLAPRAPRPWLAAAVLCALSAAPAAAQPPAPVELARGLREAGLYELANEYLSELEAKSPTGDERGSVLLERAKLLLEAADEEPDEGKRAGLVSQAKEKLSEFSAKFSAHPRAAEGLLTEAKLVAADAKETLTRARRTDLPPPGNENTPERAAYEAAIKRRAAIAAEARPKFQNASNRFAAASAKLAEQAKAEGLSPTAKKNLEREVFEARLASAVNTFNISQTYLGDGDRAADNALRAKALEDAKAVFDELGADTRNPRSAWVARAWSAETLYKLNKFTEAQDAVAAITRTRSPEAEEGRRLAQYFQLRRLAEDAAGLILANARANPKDQEKGWRNTVDGTIQRHRDWLTVYGKPRRPAPEVFAVQYALAGLLNALGDAAMEVPKDPKVFPKPTANSQKLHGEAEGLYRRLSQTDHEYTSRASQKRLGVVRKLLGDADADPRTYVTFERAQMASLIQIGKLFAAEDEADKQAAAEKPDEAKIGAARAEVLKARERVIALHERARALAGPADPANDVLDAQLRLIYFYQLDGQFGAAAVLGEHLARTARSTGGKPAEAGLRAINSYLAAADRFQAADDPEAVAAIRRADRERAAALARYLDEQYPNDKATDAARHRLAELLVNEKRLQEAHDLLVKVSPGYAQLTSARLLNGRVVFQLIAPRDSAVSAEDKLRMFQYIAAELRKVPKPVDVADAAEVRSYLSARFRLANLMIIQERADPDREKQTPGADQALALCDEVLREIPAFKSLADDGKPNVSGRELTLEAQEVRARAVYLQARRLLAQDKADDALKALKATRDAVEKDGPALNKELQGWAELAGGTAPDDLRKARAAQLAAAVDGHRADALLTAFRAEAKRGNDKEATALLELVFKCGGSVEDRLPVLEPIGRELAALMVEAKKGGRDKDAAALGKGLAVLLDKISKANPLPVPTQLFVGQTLQAIGQNGEAAKILVKVPEPATKDWRTKRPEQVPPEERGKFTNQLRDYATARHFYVKALIAQGMLAEAEKELDAILGPPDKPPTGWGSTRLYFRKDRAELYEAKGAAEADAKKANGEWGKAVREWSSLFAIQRNRITTLPAVPREMTGAQMAKAADALNQATAGTALFRGAIDQLAQVVPARNGFADAFFDVQRCVAVANQQLQKSNATALQKTFDDLGKKFVDIERQIAPADWQPEVRNRYHELLVATPPLLAAYKAAGGKLFLEKAVLK